MMLTICEEIGIGEKTFRRLWKILADKQLVPARKPPIKDPNKVKATWCQNGSASEEEIKQYVIENQFKIPRGQMIKDLEVGTRRFQRIVKRLEDEGVVKKANGKTLVKLEGRPKILDITDERIVELCKFHTQKGAAEILNCSEYYISRRLRNIRAREAVKEEDNGVLCMKWVPSKWVNNSARWRGGYGYSVRM